MTTTTTPVRERPAPLGQRLTRRPRLRMGLPDAVRAVGGALRDGTAGPEELARLLVGEMGYAWGRDLARALQRAARGGPGRAGPGRGR